MRALLAALAVTGLLILPATAQERPACERFAWPVTREAAAFAAPDLAVLAPGATLPATGAAALRMMPVAEVAFPIEPERAPKPGTLGGFVTVPALPAGLYQITLSDEAWIDVGQEGRSLKSVGQSGQRGCPTIRKSLRFRLEAAPVTIQLSGATAERIAVGIFRVEE